MDRDALRALHPPLEARYREEPDAAVVTLSAPIAGEQLATLLMLAERGCVGCRRSRAACLARRSSRAPWTEGEVSLDEWLYARAVP